MSLNFTIEKSASRSKARAAVFQTMHGDVQTPIFMPVGTNATVKSQTVETLKTTGSRMLLANTYHLLLRPGPEVFKKFGGIHRFMNWDGPVLTDSGGFQIFSLPNARAMNEEGAQFRSYVDGTTHMLSPEASIEMQKAIGSDIMMVLDHCVPSTAPYEETEAAMQLTHRWAERSLRARSDSKQALFGIVQGACRRELREQSALFLSAQPFDGLAIGGLAVGETHLERNDTTANVTDHLPAHLPRYLMGVGTPIDLLESVHRGIDMFDCIIPSQFAQRGVVFTSRGKLQLRRSMHKFSEEPVDSDCICKVCRDYSRAYLHHLVKAGEVLGWHLLTMHNLTFYQHLMAAMREAILRDDFLSFYEKQRQELVRTDGQHLNRPPEQTRRVATEARLGDYEVRDSSGFSSIRQISSGEIMHSVNNPAEEANRLYVEQSCLASRITGSSRPSEELVIWDVGLGAAFNAMAVLSCFESQWKNESVGRPLRLVSFERDLDSFRLALKDSWRFPHMRHGAPHQLLKRGQWSHTSGLLHWELVEGDFLDRLDEQKAADIIIYDPFSFKTNAELWTREVFSRIFKKSVGKGAELYTYSASTAVRVALLAADFFVAEGVGTGPKSDTTIAFTLASGAAHHPRPPALLDQGWLSRWKRSHLKSPAGLTAQEKVAFERRIESHPQFSD